MKFKDKLTTFIKGMELLGNSTSGMMYRKDDYDVKNYPKKNKTSYNSKVSEDLKSEIGLELDAKNIQKDFENVGKDMSKVLK